MLDFVPLSAKVADMGSAVENLKEYGGTVTLSGLIVVFTMLVLLVVIISIFGSVMDRRNGTKKPKALKATPTQKAEQPKANNNVLTQTSEDEDVIAAISAAVMMMYEGTGKTPVIRSIKPAQTSRSAWRQAGIINNVRSF